MSKLVGSKISKNNKSGFPGVDWHEQTQRFRVTVQIGGRKLHCGCFIKKSDAIEVSKIVRHNLIDGATYEEIKEVIKPYRQKDKKAPAGRILPTKSGKWCVELRYQNQYYYCGTHPTKKMAEKVLLEKRTSLGIE